MTKMFTLPMPGIGDRLETSLRWSHDRTFSGFVFDAADHGRTFVVELLVDGIPLDCMRAVDYVAGLAARGIGDGCYGFSFSLADDALQDAAVVEARIANLPTAIGAPIAIGDAAHGSEQASAPAASVGAIRWLGGLQFSGWVPLDGEPFVDILLDGERIDRVRASGWNHTGEAQDARAVRAFDVDVPERFADGSARRLAAINMKGEHLEGSPLPFVAFANGLDRTVAGPAGARRALPRGEPTDGPVPTSVPFAQYGRWRADLPEYTESGAGMKAAVMAVGAGNIDLTLESLNAQGRCDWIAASLPETADFAGFQNHAARTFLAGDGVEAEFVVFLLSGTRLSKAALARISATFTARQAAEAVYGDLDVASADGSIWPLAFPAFDYERMLEQGYCGHVFALRRSAAERALKSGADNLYRVFNCLLDGGLQSAERIVHIPGSIAVLPSLDLDAAARTLAAATQLHLTQRGDRAQVAAAQGRILPAVTAARKVGDARVSIVIPTRNRREPLEACLASIEPALRKRRCEIIVVDNDSSDPEMLRYLASIAGPQLSVVAAAGDRNDARLTNMAAAKAGGEYLCLLSCGVRAQNDGWLDEMIGRLSSPDVGAVGTLLSWPSGIVQHGGIVLGPHFSVAAAFGDRMDDDAGYGDLLRVAHECSAVATACLLTRRKDYIDLGGMDAFRFPLDFAGVDYCLKLRAAGKRVVWTPHARLVQLESASRGVAPADGDARYQRELRNLRAKWADVLAADPFYSPVLSLDGIPFAALASTCRSMAARTSAPPIPVVMPPGF